jgi:hypothetical protein
LNTPEKSVNSFPQRKILLPCENPKQPNPGGSKTIRIQKGKAEEQRNPQANLSVFRDCGKLVRHFVFLIVTHRNLSSPYNEKA